MKKSKITYKFPKGQTARLQKSVKRLKISIFIGCMMLVAVYVSNFIFAHASKMQVENTVCLNKYQNASKMLTSSARLFTVTGEEIYYNSYYKELNEDKNRENAIAVLEKNALSDVELSILYDVNSISDSLVLLEKEAMELAKAGNVEAAEQILFGDEYEGKTAQISQKTETVIDDILQRLEKNKTIFRTVQLCFDFLFFTSFLVMVYQGMKTIIFSEKEILEPVVEVSEQMNQLAKGNLHFSYESIEEVDSEVDQMKQSIGNMKQNFILMIGEISDVLEKVGNGDYRVELKQEYIGDFAEIKDSISKIIERMTNSLQTIQDVACELNGGAENLTSAADGLANACTSQAGQVSDIMILMGDLRDAISVNEKQAEEAVKISKSSEEILQENHNKLMKLQIVAEECNTVAEKIREFTQGEIEITSETRELLDKTRKVIKNVSELAGDSNNNMEEVILCSNETSERLENIVERLQREVDTIRMLDENVAEVAGIVDNNSATSEETAAISEEQQAQVERLVQLLENYKL